MTSSDTPGPSQPAEGGAKWFADRIILRARRLGHPLCVGLDPQLDRLPPLFRRGDMSPGAPASADAVREFCLAFLVRVAARAVCLKPQSACFEQLGPPGAALLADLMAAARAADCPVLLDAKRGDIGSTAEAYARAYLDEAAVMPADALTVNPYLGLDSLEPFLQRVRSAGRGVFVLVKTSNPGSRDFQGTDLDGTPLFLRVSRALAPLAAQLQGPETGFSSLGVVVGATYPAEALRIRAALPRALFLIPGYGAQGASAADAVQAFAPGPRGLEGGLVNSSRALMFPPAAAQADSAARWEQAIDEALDRATAELGDAVSR